MTIFCVKIFSAEPIKIIIRAPKILCIVNYACRLIYRFISDTRLTRTSGRVETVQMAPAFVTARNCGSY